MRNDISIERNLTYLFVPGDIHNPHKKNLPLPMSFNQCKVYNQHWTANTQMIIDVIGDMFRLVNYGRGKPKWAQLKEKIQRYSHIDIKELVDKSGYINDEKQYWRFEFSLNEMRIHYPMVSKMTPKRLLGLIDGASNIRLFCPYRYKVIQEEAVYNPNTGKTKYKYTITKYVYNTNVPQRLFTGLYDNTKYLVSIKFNTGIGTLFANNVLAAEWEWLPFDFYNLNNANAQNFFRKALLKRKKGTVIRHTLDDIAMLLNIGTNNTTAKKQNIINTLNILKENKFIDFNYRRVGKAYVFDIERRL